jgi:threonine/homoserine/homoserine lactone efflux protein
MTVETYLLFVAASVVLVLVPGPDMAYMLARCIAQGRRAGVMAALGINLGAYVHLAASVTGLSALLMTSSVAYTAIRWIGAAYLIYLGISSLLAKGNSLPVDMTAARGQSNAKIFWQGFASDVLNPKVAIFFLALLPQFVPAQSGNPTMQLLMLGLTVNIIALPINLALVFASARVTQSLRRSNRVTTLLHKAMGLMFVGLGLRLAVEKP